jgi:hypothetical protein
MQAKLLRIYLRNINKLSKSYKSSRMMLRKRWKKSVLSSLKRKKYKSMWWEVA